MLPNFQKGGSGWLGNSTSIAPNTAGAFCSMDHQCLADKSTRIYFYFGYIFFLKGKMSIQRERVLSWRHSGIIHEGGWKTAADCSYYAWLRCEGGSCTRFVVSDGRMTAKMHDSIGLAVLERRKAAVRIGYLLLNLGFMLRVPTYSNYVCTNQFFSL